jgi:hypothetical protein
VNSVEDRLHAAMSAAGDLAAREIRTAPPLRLPSEPDAGARRRHPPRRWVRWAAPLTAAAAVVALAIALVLVKGIQNGGAVPASPATSASPGAPTGPGGAPRYYAALTKNQGIVVGDSVTGKTLGTLTPPSHKASRTFFRDITAAADDQAFVVTAATYPAASTEDPGDIAKATITITWYLVRLAPGTAHPVSLTLLPIKPRAVHGSSELVDTATALSGSGEELAVTGFTAAGGLTVQVFSVATGQLLREWSTSDPSLSLSESATRGLSGPPTLTWIDGDRVLALDAYSATPQSKSTQSFLGFGAEDIVRELNVAGPSSGDLLKDGKVVWNVQTWEYPVTLLQACTGGRGATQFISADGTTFGCAAVTGPGTDPNLSFLTYPLTTGAMVAKQARIDYQVTQMAQKGVSTQQALWISPSGDALIGAWTTYAAGTLEDAANGLHIGVMSGGKFTPLRFPPGFDQAANVASITW